MTNICVLGSGGREYAIIKSLVKNKNHQIYCYSNKDNYYLIQLCQYYRGDMTTDSIYNFCKKNNIKIVVIGSENLLADGVCDYLEMNGISCVGPIMDFAKIETNKYFARRLLINKFSSYNPYFIVIEDKNTLNKDILYQLSSFGKPYVIKPTGLCGGKGVKIYGEHLFSHDEATLYVKEMLENGHSVLVEERLYGQEFSFITFTDGITCLDCPPLQDYKRLYNNDEGPNTGSMGCYTYYDHESQIHTLPFLSTHDIDSASHVNRTIIQDLNDYFQSKYSYNFKYRGILYGSYIKTNDNKLKIIEFNARLGDPEAINIFELMESDAAELFIKLTENNLQHYQLKFKKQSSISKYLVSQNYPYNSEPSKIAFNNNINNYFNNIVFGNNYFENSHLNIISRGLAIVACDALLEKCQNFTEFIVQNISGYYHHRSDIGVLKNNKNMITYSSAGVDIDKGNEIVNDIKNDILQTYNDAVYSKFGDFSGLINLPTNDDYVLVTSIDGCGTKSDFLPKMFGEKSYTTLGIDIMNHSVNDILVKGGRPFFFLDYIASNNLSIENVKRVVSGMSYSCKKHNCVLIGGETAEMPGVYQSGSYDIVGCIVGLAKKSEIIDGPKNITPYDVVIGLPSIGLHTNGYSLIRKLYNTTKLSKDLDLMRFLENSHKSYYDDIDLLYKNNVKINGLCHITGGGLIDNPPRVLPKNCKMVLNKKYISNRHYDKIKNLGSLNDEEMYKTFNCGIGMLIILDKDNASILSQIYKNNNIKYFELGAIYEKYSYDPSVIIKSL